MAASTRRLFLQSTLAAYVIQLGRLAASFGAKVALAHLVLPEGHGLYELALRIVTVAAACRDLGLPYHLMRDPRRPYGTVLASGLGLGLALTVAVAFGAPLAAGLDPDLPAILRVMSVWILLDGLAVVPRVFFERELRVGRLVGPEVLRTVAVAVVSVGLAWLGWGVWSFVAGDLAGTALLAGALWFRARGKIPLAVEPRLIPELIRRSRYLFGIWLVLQLVTYVDVFIVEAYADTLAVGLYARAYMIALLVATIAWPRPLFPALVEFADDAAAVFQVFRLGTAQLFALQALASYFLLFNAELTVAILLGEEWGGAVPILRILAFTPFVSQFALLGGELLKARHEDRAWLMLEVANLVSLVAAGVWLTSRYGAPGMAAANFALLGAALLAVRLARLFGEQAKTLAADIGVLLLVPLPLFGLAAWWFPAGSGQRLAASLAAAAVAGGLFLLRFLTPFRAFLRGGVEGVMELQEGGASPPASGDR